MVFCVRGYPTKPCIIVWMLKNALTAFHLLLTQDIVASGKNKRKSWRCCPQALMYLQSQTWYGQQASEMLAVACHHPPSVRVTNAEQPLIRQKTNRENLRPRPRLSNLCRCRSGQGAGKVCALAADEGLHPTRVCSAPGANTTDSAAVSYPSPLHRHTDSFPSPS